MFRRRATEGGFSLVSAEDINSPLGIEGKAFMLSYQANVDTAHYLFASSVKCC